MQKLQKILRCLFVLALIPNAGFADTGSREEQALEKWVTNYRKVQTLQELIEAAPMTIRDYNFLQSLDSKYGKMKPAKVRRLGNSIEIVSNGYAVTFELISIEKQIFAINHKQFHFSDAMNPVDRLKLILKALPKTKVSSTDLLFPKAYADGENMKVAAEVTGAGLGGLGIIAFLTGFSTIAVPLIICSMVVTGTVVSAYSTIENNNRTTCQKSQMALDDCIRQTGIVTLYSRENTAALQQLRSGALAKKASHVNGPPAVKDAVAKDVAQKQVQAEKFNEVVKAQPEDICPPNPLNLDLDKETAKVVSDVERTGQNTDAWLWGTDCPKATREKVKTCMDNLGGVAKALCFTLTVNAIETTTGDKVKDPPKGLLTEGNTPAAIPDAPPPLPVKAVIEKSDTALEKPNSPE